MKKIILLSAILGLSVAGTTAQNAIPNPGFENWTNSACYDDPIDWGTLNSQTGCFGSTVIKATGADVHSGSFAIKLESISIFGNDAPGLAITGIINTGNQTFDGGVAYNLRPCSISGWYKYSPSGTDTGMVEVTFSKLNVEIGTGKFTVTNTVNTYTSFTATINYVSNQAPDTFMIVLASTSLNTIQVGSIMFIDDLSFDTTAAPTPTVTASGPLTFCSGQSLTLTSTAATTYQWFEGATLLAGETQMTYTANAGGNYTVMVTDVNGCTAVSAATIVTLNPSPVIDSTSSTDVTVCGANDGTITITASSGTPPLLYSIDNGANFSNSGNFTGLSTGSYPVVVSDVNNCTVTGSTLTITAPGAPPAPTAGTNATYCDGDAMADLTATAGSGGTLTWYSNPGLTDTIGMGTTITPDTTIGTTTYYVTETFAGCQSPSNLVDITVNPLPTPIIMPNGDTLTASSASTYQWNLNGSPITNAISQSYVATATGSYTVTVTDLNGCTNTSDSVNVTISGINQFRIFGNQLKIYPNPASDELFILSNTVDAKFLIVDLLGKGISEIVLNKSINKLNTSTISDGIYIFNLIDTNKNLLERGKLIISR